MTCLCLRPPCPWPSRYTIHLLIPDWQGAIHFHQGSIYFLILANFLFIQSGKTYVTLPRSSAHQEDFFCPCLQSPFKYCPTNHLQITLDAETTIYKLSLYFSFLCSRCAGAPHVPCLWQLKLRHYHHSQEGQGDLAACSHGLFVPSILASAWSWTFHIMMNFFRSAWHYDLKDLIEFGSWWSALTSRWGIRSILGLCF